VLSGKGMDMEGSRNMSGGTLGSGVGVGGGGWGGGWHHRQQWVKLHEVVRDRRVYSLPLVRR
jgi:hypothetical protein